MVPVEATPVEKVISRIITVSCLLFDVMVIPDATGQYSTVLSVPSP